MKQIEIKYIIISTITLNVNGLYCKALCKQTSLMIKIAANFIECLSHVRHSANPSVLYLVYSLQWPRYYLHQHFMHVKTQTEYRHCPLLHSPKRQSQYSNPGCMTSELTPLSYSECDIDNGC